MSLAEQLSNPTVPGAGVRAALIRKGINAGQEQMLAFLIERGIVRKSMFGDSFVAVAEYLPEGESTLDWKAIDLPKDLADWQPKGEEN